MARPFVRLALIALCALAARADSSDDLVYHALVERVLGGDMSTDFRSLRMFCVKASDCDPRGGTAEMAELNRAIEARDLKAEVEIGERILTGSFVNIETHSALATAYAALREADKAAFHRQIATALMRSILTSGDGKSVDKAFEVISEREEFLVMVVLHLPYAGQANLLVPFEDGTHHYVKRQVRDASTSKPVLDPKTRKAVEVFFNVDAFSEKGTASGNN